MSRSNSCWETLSTALRPGMQSRRIAWPAVQRIEAFWSRPPVEAPAISFSDLMAILISVTRPSSVAP